jgi:hypothetical protein
MGLFGDFCDKLPARLINDKGHDNVAFRGHEFLKAIFGKRRCHGEINIHKFRRGSKDCRTVEGGSLVLSYHRWFRRRTIITPTPSNSAK